ncbi:MAG: four helix bundle protein [Candidatus Omnitrophota bacterium]
MRISKFEDIKTWNEAKILVNMVYDLTDKPLFKKDYGLRDQIQRAAVSSMSNIAEGFDGGSNSQFIQYLIYSRRSSSEIQSLLYVALDRKYIIQKEFDEVYEQAKKVGKLLNGFIKYLKQQKVTGQLVNRLTG